jgi:hypothetical protein
LVVVDLYPFRVYRTLDVMTLVVILGLLLVKCLLLLRHLVGEYLLLLHQFLHRLGFNQMIECFCHTRMD